MSNSISTRFVLSCWFLVLLTLGVLLAGAYVTTTGSGLSVPDWPLSYGQWFPSMVGGVFYEHGHRMIAGSAAFWTLCLAVLIFWVPALKGFRLLACLLLGAVLIQAALGGLTVILRLPKAVSISHAVLGQGFFCLAVILAIQTTFLKNPMALPASKKLAWLTTGLTLGFFIQLFLGAATRHFHAGLSIPDFPTVFGGWVPKEWSLPVSLALFHRWGAYTLVALSIALVIYIYRKFENYMALVMVSGLLLALLSIQILLGAMVIWLKRPMAITSFHLVVGALCLACSVALTSFSWQGYWKSQETQ